MVHGERADAQAALVVDESGLDGAGREHAEFGRHEFAAVLGAVGGIEGERPVEARDDLFDAFRPHDLEWCAAAGRPGVDVVVADRADMVRVVVPEEDRPPDATGMRPSISAWVANQ